MADLVTTVANKFLPISTEAAMEEAESAGQLLRKIFSKLGTSMVLTSSTAKGKVRTQLLNPSRKGLRI